MGPERAVDVVVLAVDVGGNGAPDCHLTGPGRDGDEPAERNRDVEELVDGNTSSQCHRAVVGDGSNRVEASIVEDDTATEQSGVAITASESSRNHLGGVRQDLLDLGLAGGALDVGNCRRGATPTGEFLAAHA